MNNMNPTNVKKNRLANCPKTNVLQKRSYDNRQTSPRKLFFRVRQQKRRTAKGHLDKELRAIKSLLDKDYLAKAERVLIQKIHQSTTLKVRSLKNV